MVNIKYSKNEIKKAISESKIYRQIYISDDTYIEEFRQIKINGVYIPYLISSFGRIFSLFYGKSNNFNVKELKPNSNSTMYYKITIHYNNVHYNLWLHRLVAEAFIKKRHKHDEVNHIDGNHKNNYVWNLEWVSHYDNVQHAIRTGLTHHPFGEACNCKYDIKTIKKVCQLISDDISPKDIMRLTNVSKNLIQGILHKRKWKSVSCNYDFSNYNYLRNKK